MIERSGLRRAIPLGIAGMLILCAAWGLAAPGDVTGDGAIDGRDALRVMRQVEGFSPLTPGEAEAADISPAPGTEGRFAGDGAITEEDALRMLYHAVGLVSEGEITGDFSGSAPRILDFTPKSGPAGTEVTITGRNFVGPWLGENGVFFGEYEAGISGMTSARITVHVPAGAGSGAIRVQTPGGSCLSSREFIVTEEIPGRVDLGAGLNPEDFTVVSIFGETTPAPGTGEFTLRLPADRLAVIGAVPKGPGENCFLALRLPEEAVAPRGASAARAQAGALVIDAESTAYALIFMHPFLITADRTRARALLGTMEPLPAVQNLIGVIGQRYPLGANGLDDPQVEAAWGLAVAAVMGALPAGTVFDANQAAAPRGLSATEGGENPLPARAAALALAEDPNVRIWGIDLDYLAFRYNAESQAVDPRLTCDYSPVDWLVAFYRLDPRDLPNGVNERFADLKKRNIRRLGYEKSTMVAGNLWTAKIDILGQGMDFVMGTALDWVGLGGDDPDLPLENSEDAIYMIRAFSGSFKDRWQFSGDDAVAMKAFAGDTRMSHYATGINVTLALLDVWGLVAGEESTPGKEAIKGAFQNALAALASELGSRALGDLSSSDALKSLLNVVVEAGKGVAAAYANEGISQAQEKLQGTLKKAFGKAIPLLEILSKISSVGRIGERIVGLMGYIVSPLDLEIVYGPTPLEAAFVLVGDPFSPVIESFSPTSGGPTTEITLTGRNFDPNASGNLVKFRGVLAETVSVNPEGTRLVVRVPTGLAEWYNPINLSVETPASLRAGSLGGFTFKDIPVLNSLSVASGYAQSGNPEGKPFAGFAGTVVGLTGWKLNRPASGPNLEVYFGFTPATIIFQSSVSLQVNVPAMASTGPHDVYIRYMTDEGWRETRHLSFFVYGPPQISQVTPTTASAGALLDITGGNLVDCRVLVKDATAPVRVLEPLTHVVATMPNVGEGGEQLPLEVWNPAGSASRTITRQPGIQAPEPQILPGGFLLIINTDEATIQANGNLSLDEAMAFARGDLNFWSGNAFDDVNEEWTHSWRQVRYGSDPDYTYEWIETGIQKTVLTTNNGHEHETRKHFRINTWHPDYGGHVDGPFLDWTEDLDNGSDEEHGLEEGDRLQKLSGTLLDFPSYNGANFSDRLQPETGVHTYLSNTGIRVGRSDTIDFRDTTIHVNSGENLLLDDTFVSAPAIVSSSPIRIEGSNVTLGPSFGYQRLEIRGGAGIQIAQSFRARIGSLRMVSPGGDAVTLTNSGLCEVAGIFENPGGAGIRATDSDENSFSGTVTGGGGAGFMLERGRNNEIYGIVAQNCAGAGLEIAGSEATIIYQSQVDACGSGILLTGATQTTLSQARIENCSNNGITITGGRANRVTGSVSYSIQCLRNQGHGVEINGSSLNELWYLECAGNHKSGLAIHGPDATYNDIFNFTSGRYTNPANYENLLLGNTEHGIHLYGGANHNTIGMENQLVRLVDNGGHGALVEGAGTSYNTIYCLAGYGHSVSDSILGGNGGDGLRFSGGASHNLVTHSMINGNESNGLTFEGAGTEYNSVEDSRIGTTVVRQGEIQTPKPNLGMALWISAPARLLSVSNTKFGLHDIGAIYCGQMNSAPPEGEWNASFTNCHFNHSDFLDIPLGAKAAAPQQPAPARIGASPGIGIQIDASSYCRLQNCIIQNYRTGLWIGGAPSTGHSLSVNVMYCAQDGAYLERVHDQYLAQMDCSANGRHGLYMKECSAIATGASQMGGQENAQHGVLAENCEGVIFKRFVCNENGGDGLRVTNSRQIEVLSSYFSDNALDGVSVIEGSSGVTFNGGFCDWNGEHGLRIENAQNVAVSFAEFFDNPAGAILVKNSAHVEIGSEESAESVSMGCEDAPALAITGSATSGVRARAIYFSFNTYQNLPIIQVDGGGDILIGHEKQLLGNFICGDGRTGILASGNVSNLRILNNQIGALPNPPYVKGSNQYGIMLDQGIHGVIVNGNTIAHSDSHGILIQGGANANAITGNRITDNGGDGVRISGAGSNRNLLSRNVITGNAGKGIALANGGNNGVSAPLITNISPGSRAISGSIDPVPPAGTQVEVYADRADEGESLLGVSPVFGNNFSISGPVPPARMIHAVAVHPGGDTSEFGPSRQMDSANRLPFVFTEGGEGERNIKARDPDWLLPQPLVFAAGDDFDPQLAPDGTALLFTSDRGGNLNVYYHAIPAGTDVALTSEASDEFDPAWLGGAGNVAFVSNRHGNNEIYSVAFDPSKPIGNLQRFTGDIVSAVSSPALEGYFVLFLDGPRTLSDIEFYIAQDPAPFLWRIYNFDDSAVEPSTLLASGMTSPTLTGWHRVSIPPLAVPAKFVVGYTNITNNQPSFGRAESAASDSSFYFYSAWDLWSSFTVPIMIRIPAAPPVVTRLTDHPADDRHPSWSPDGAKIVFTSDRGGSPDLWIMDANGANPRRLTDGAGANTRPAWSPDGATIAFVSDRSGHNEIYTIRANGADLRQVTNAIANNTDPAWAAGGNFLFYSSNKDSGFEIYGVEPQGGRAWRMTYGLFDAAQPNAAATNLALDPVPLRARSAASATAATSGDAARGVARAVFPDATCTLTLQSASARAGESVRLALTLTGASAMGNLAFQVEYDPAVLEVTQAPEVGLGLAPYALAPDTFPDDSGVLLFNGVRAAGVSGEGEALGITFRVKPSALPHASPVIVSLARGYGLDLASQTPDALGGQIKVQSAPAAGCLWVLIGP